MPKTGDVLEFDTRIRTIFAEDGVKNVSWRVFCENGLIKGACLPRGQRVLDMADIAGY